MMRIIALTLAMATLALHAGCGANSAAEPDYILTYTETSPTDQAVQQKLTIMPDGQYSLLLADNPPTEGRLPPEFWEQLRIWQSEIPSFTYNSPTVAISEAAIPATDTRATLHWSSHVSGKPDAGRPQRMLEWTKEMLVDLAEPAAQE